MSIVVIEKKESPAVESGNDPSYEVLVSITGTNDPSEAQTAALGYAPASINVYGADSQIINLKREGAKVTPVSDDLFDGVIKYTQRKQAGDSAYSFETTGGTQKVTQSKETISSHAASGTAPDLQGAIGYNGEDVEGVDVTIPVYNFSETHYFAKDVVDGSYKSALFQCTGKVNGDSFRGFEAGEVLFLGASGSLRGDDVWEITFNFSALPNATGLSVGEISGVDKKGWQYMWVRYEDEEDTTAKSLVKRPTAVYVERVYDDGDFSTLGIGTD